MKYSTALVQHWSNVTGHTTAVDSDLQLADLECVASALIRVVFDL